MKADRFRPDTQGEVIASWGTAKLIKTPDFKYKLVGGSPAEREEAKEWIATYFKGSRVEGI